MFDISWNNCQEAVFSYYNDELKSTHNHNVRTFLGRDTVCKPDSKSALLSILVFPVYLRFSSLRLYMMTYFSLSFLLCFLFFLVLFIIIVFFFFIYYQFDFRPFHRSLNGVTAMYFFHFFPLPLHKRAKSCHRMTSRWTKSIICHAATHNYSVTMAPNSIYIIQLKHEGFARQRHI